MSHGNGQSFWPTLRSVNLSGPDISEESSLTGFPDSAILKARAVSRLYVCEALPHGRTSHRDIVVDPLGAAAIYATPKAPTSQVPVRFDKVLCAIMRVELLVCSSGLSRVSDRFEKQKQSRSKKSASPFFMHHADH
jgi:hypothetical protein